MKQRLNLMQININGMEEFKRCADNVLKSAQQLEEAVQEFNECKLIMGCCTKAKKTTNEVDLYPSFSKPICLTSDTECDIPFGREDLDDIISDLQEEYYRLGKGKGKGNVLTKVQIANAIDRLCRLRETLEVIYCG